MALKDILFEYEYRNLKRDVIREFYIPALSNAVSYQRAVGFFSSSALVDISYGLEKLIQNGGHIELVASPKLTKDDLRAIEMGYQMRDAVVEEALLREWKEPENAIEQKRYNLLANYIAAGKLDIKIAFIHSMEEKAFGIFHEKLGLISDGQNTVAFSGSLNETTAGFYFNYESIDVYCDWRSTESYERILTKKAAFQRIWNNVEEHIEVVPFPNIMKDKMAAYRIEPVSENYEEEILRNEERMFLVSESAEEGPRIPGDFHFRKYQEEAVDNWRKNGFCGIFDMATGTGKTFTALLAMYRLVKEKKNHLAVIIVCPYQHLVEQWVEDLLYFAVRPIVGYSGSAYKNYKKNLSDAVFQFLLGVQKFICFICTNATYRTRYVQEQMRKLGKDTLIIIDEAHNFGAQALQNCLLPELEYRLALSATLERHHDESGTQTLYSYFHQKCMEYTMEKAIDEHMLTPYKYYPIIVSLTQEELELYQKYTEEISKCFMKQKNGSTKLSKKGEILVLKRAQLVAGARNKIEKLKEVIRPYQEQNNLLVYCGATKIMNDEWMEDQDAERQIDLITKMLGNDLHMRVAKFTSQEDKEQRRLRIKYFKEEGLQCLVAIKCLDEGVNIPNIRTAFILASTTNPKEYIQRRGRVLRLYEGKQYAEIYDFITLPREWEELENLPYETIKGDASLVKNEIVRMQEFKRLSLNPYDSDLIINNLVECYHLYTEIQII